MVAALWQMAVGAMASTTVTVALQVAVLPALSVTVSVTGLAPRLAQVKLAGATLREAMPQLSEEPLLMRLAETLPVPLALRLTVRFWQTATGVMRSATVTVWMQVRELPLASVAVQVTLVTPAG